MFLNAPQELPDARSYTIPAPVGGMTDNFPIDQTPELYARDLVNIFPDNDVIKFRNGFREHSRGLGSGVVSTICEFQEEDGTRHLLAAANGQIFDASTFGEDARPIGSGFTSDQWQTVTMSGAILFFNGQDQPRLYDGNSLSAATYTGISDDSRVINCAVYRSRLYLVERNSQSIWYGGVEARTGALTEFSVAGELTRGGFIQFAKSYSRETGAGLTDFLIIGSNQGELLIYSGSSPNGSDWTKAGQFFIGDTLGRRSAVEIPGDLVIITSSGLVPVSEIIKADDVTAQQVKFKNNIRKRLANLTGRHRDNFGWTGLVYPDQRMAIFNVPVVPNGAYEQYIQNITTGAWCRFTGIPSVCWTLFNNKPYFGGIDGRIYEFDFGTNDDGEFIEVLVSPAFSYFGNRATQKQIIGAQPILVGSGPVQFGYNVDVDFEDGIETDTVELEGGAGTSWFDPWFSVWSRNNFPSAEHASLAGVGRAFSIKLSGRYRGLRAYLSSTKILYREAQTTAGYL